jgi:2-polyprenyl-3-methyl-5-hydroxy-6-metoxy-1,4-benzoquinol methylase
VEKDRERWNDRYRGDGYFHGMSPAAVLVEHLELILRLAPGRRALDVACGEGRNAICLARHGFAVTALDIAEQGIAKGQKAAAEAGLAIDFRVVDLESSFPDGQYDFVLNVNFLLRNLIPHLVSSLAPGGILLFSSILAGHGGGEWRNPLHLLAPGELVSLCTPLPGEIIASRELPDDPLPTAMVLFQRFS